MKLFVTEVEMREYWKEYFRAVGGNDSEMSKSGTEMTVINLTIQEKKSYMKKKLQTL